MKHCELSRNIDSCLAISSRDFSSDIHEKKKCLIYVWDYRNKHHISLSRLFSLDSNLISIFYIFFDIFVSKSYEFLLACLREYSSRLLDSDCMCSTSMKIEKKKFYTTNLKRKKKI